jgi:hypothetical protein
MTHIRPTRILTVVAWIACSAAMFAQSGSIAYNPAEETTIAGTILHVVSLQAPDGYGVHFDLKTATGLVNVHVSPAAYIGEKNFWFFADEEIEITGVKVFLDGNKSFLVRTIVKTADGKKLNVRTADGTPLWKPATDGTDGCGVAHPALPRGTEL